MPKNYTTSKCSTKGAGIARHISSSMTSKMSQSFNKSKAKNTFVDESEETKYRSYLQHVETLNKMKDHLGAMHKSMSKEVIKRLVVSIKRMETDLTFYENNWHLFRSPNLDYVPGLEDIVEQN